MFLRLKLVERAEPQIINSSDIKIKIIYSGICGSDLQVLKKNQQIVTDIIIGHEAVGEIVEIGKPLELKNSKGKYYELYMECLEN